MMPEQQLVIFKIALFLTQFAAIQSKQPNIVFILTDDQGYYDVGYRGSEVLTPHIDELAAAGVRLENYYVQPICTPSRSVLLTGRYQIHTGMQRGVLSPGQKFGVPLELPLLSEELQKLGYATHMVGKWHLGYYQKEYVPTYRGFDTFFGLYNGFHDYYEKTYGDGGYDLHYNNGSDLSVAWNNTVYSTIAFADRAVNIINEHDQEKPLFMYLAFTAPHTPLQVPQKYSEMYSWIQNNDRRTYNAMVTCTDDAIKNVTDALKQAEIFDDTIIIFSTDNGGSLNNGASNWPLRGHKNFYYEGGIKSTSFVHSSLLSSNRTINNELMHISDWFPTLIHIAGGDTEDLEIDGYNQWESICCGQPSLRDEILHNINPLERSVGENLYPDIFDVRVQAALRVGPWKILTGANSPPAIGERPPLPSNTQESWNVKTEGNADTDIRQQADKNIWLFNTDDDPTESFDLSDSNPEIVLQMLQKLAIYNSTAWEAVNYGDLADPDYDPEKYGGAHVPWL